MLGAAHMWFPQITPHTCCAGRSPVGAPTWLCDRAVTPARDDTARHRWRPSLSYKTALSAIQRARNSRRLSALCGEPGALPRHPHTHRLGLRSARETIWGASHSLLTDQGSQNGRKPRRWGRSDAALAWESRRRGTRFAHGRKRPGRTAREPSASVPAPLEGPTCGLRHGQLCGSG